MKVTHINTTPRSAFDIHADFVLETEDITEIGEWVSLTFANNFILLEFSERCVLGGAADNKKAWKAKQKLSHTSIRQTIGYQIRGYKKDITMFLLKYKGQ